MRLSDKWKDYELLDCTDGERLERWGDIILIRPDPQVIWKTGRKHPMWRKANARYNRSQTGGGKWELLGKLPDRWEISYGDLKFNIKTMGFKHTGLFPEQATNWDLVRGMIESADRPLKVLNLFAYTGGATVAAAAAGASVCHVDASKGMVAWAKDNAKVSGLADKPVRYIVDDVLKFVLREQRRGNKYHAIIMDPPSYGRGPNGEIWKLENELYNLVSECVKVLDDNPLFFIINSYTTGLAPSVLSSILTLTAGKKFKIKSIQADELGLPVTEGGIVLPCGSTARCIFGE